MPGILLKLLFSRAGLTVLAAVILLGVCGYYAHKAKITAAERDEFRAGLSIANAQLDAQAAISESKIKAIETVRENDRDRSEFKNEGNAAIERGRVAGDGPVAPVLRDTVQRVQQRYNTYQSEKRNP